MMRKQQEALDAARENLNRRNHVQSMLMGPNRQARVAFNSRAEFQAMDAAYRSLSNDDEQDEEDEDKAKRMTGYPVTDAQYAALVDKLVAAIMDFSDIVDKPMKRKTSSNTTMSSSAVRAIEGLATLEVQLLAWKILLAICDAHLGKNNIPFWTNVWKYNHYEDFLSRFKEVCHAIRRSKALIKSILDTDIPFVQRLAAGPRAEYKMKRENRHLNDKRSDERQEYKKRKLEEKAEAGKDGDDSAE